MTSTGDNPADDAETADHGTPTGSGTGEPLPLHRFVVAQDYVTGDSTDPERRSVYERALDELRAGRKRSHWIWIIFPQATGLGSSFESQMYGIDSPAEARAYLHHAVLGPRLVECCRAVLSHTDRSAEELLGSDVDAAKLCSSATLFAGCDSEHQPVFEQILDRCFDGRRDPFTVRFLHAKPPDAAAR